MDEERGLLRQLRHRSLPKVHALFLFACVGYNLVRMRRLLAEPSLLQRAYGAVGPALRECVVRILAPGAWACGCARIPLHCETPPTHT